MKRKTKAKGTGPGLFYFLGLMNPAAPVYSLVATCGGVLYNKRNKALK